MASKPNFYITCDNFKLLVGRGFWEIRDIPPERCEQVRPFLNNIDTVGVFASGIAPIYLERSSADDIGGLDRIRLEPNPKDKEPDLNVDHFIIGRPDSNGYPVYGPYKNGGIIPHWPQDNAIDEYWKK